MSENTNNESFEGRETSTRAFKTPEIISLTDNTLGLIGTSHKGPAFVPQTFSSYLKDDSPTGILNTFENVFGDIESIDEQYLSHFTATNWFNQGGEQLAFTRILGVGETGIPNDDGIVIGSGFEVGKEVVSGSTTLGKKSDNSFSTQGGDEGRTEFLGAVFVNNQFTTSDGINRISSYNDYLEQIGYNSGVTEANLITDVILCASGSSILLESSNDQNQITDRDLASIQDALPDINFSNNKVGNTSSRRVPYIFIKGLKDKTKNSLNDFRSNRYEILKKRYSENFLNREKDNILHKGHYVYSSFYPNEGVTGFKPGFNSNRFFIVEGNNNRIDYENFVSKFTTAKTPWIVSQPLNRSGIDNNRQNIHEKCIKLFRFYSLDDGEIGNRFRIRVTPQKIGSNLNRSWSRFTVKVWEYDVKTNKFNDLLEYKDLTLDPDSPDYIGFVFGTKHDYYNMETKKIETAGLYESKNNYLRVEIDSDIEYKNLDAYEYMPSGFMPYPRLNTTDLLFNGDETKQRPLEYTFNLLYQRQNRFNFTDAEDAQLTDNKYWGVLFDKTISHTFVGKIINGVTYQFRGRKIINHKPGEERKYYSYTKYFQNNYNNKDKNVWTTDLEDNTSDSTNAFFHLEKILYEVINGDQSAEDKWKFSIYRRDGKDVSSISSLSGLSGFYKYVNIDELLKSDDENDSVNSEYLSFDFFTYGGFDGVDILDRDKRLMNQSAFVREIEDETNTNKETGPTRFAYELAHDITVDESNCEIDILAFPSIGHNKFNKYVSNIAGEKGKYLSVLNVADYSSSSILLDNNYYLINYENPDQDLRISEVLDIGDTLDKGIDVTISSISNFYYNNRYTFNVMNTLKGEIKVGNITDKFITVLPAYQAISAFANSLSAPVDSILSFNEDSLDITGIFNNVFTDSSNNSYSRIIRNSINSKSNINLIVSKDNQFKLNSGNTSIINTNSLSRYAHNTRILLDIKKKIKYSLFLSDILLFNNNSKIENVNINLNQNLNSLLSGYLNDGIIKNFYVSNNTGLKDIEIQDKLNNILRTKIAISFFGKSDSELEEIRLDDILNIAQNNLTDNANFDIIKPSI